MLGGLLVLIVSGVVSFLVIDNLKRRHSFINASLLKGLFFYHVVLSVAYYSYVLFNPSDSRFYYQKVIMGFRGETWGSFYGTSTTFIEFLGYPFIRFMGFSYEAVMALFAFFGFLGFVYFYVFFKENIRFKHTFLGANLLTLIFFLPNLHFWSSSFGKGSVIFLGLGLYFFGISKIKMRWFAILIGGVIIYHVRPHIMLVVLLSSLIGFLFSQRAVGVVWRVFFVMAAAVAFFFIYQDVLNLVGIDEDQPIAQGLDLSHRATELTHATSGVDITSYSLPLQVLTFLYRPLFFDAPGILGIIVSFENVFYLLLTLQFFSSLQSVAFILRASALAKSAFLSFLTVTVALAQISGNLGIAMRQKSQVMILFLFVVMCYLDERKLFKWKQLKQRDARLQQMRTRLSSVNSSKS
jgi:hypothetical protein